MGAGAGLPRRAVTLATGPRGRGERGALPRLLPFAGPVLLKTNRAAPACPCNDSVAAKFNIPR